MISKLLPRLLGVLGIFAAAIAAFWAMVRFGFATQDGLSADLIGRLDGDPARVQAYLDEMVGSILRAGAAAMLVAAVCACIWLFLIERSPPYGDKSARAKRGSWAGLMILALVIGLGLFWVQVIGAPVSETLARSVPLYTTLIGLLLVAAGYWLSTALFAPASTKVAIPGGTIFSR